MSIQDTTSATAETVKHILDGGLGVMLTSSPLWVQYLAETAQIVAMIGGATLVVLRVLIAIRELRHKKK